MKKQHFFVLLFLPSLLSLPLLSFAALDKSGSIVFTLTPQDVYPPSPVADLAASPGAEGEANLTWTAPSEDDGVLSPGDPAMAYELHAATVSVAGVGGDTTTWLNDWAFVVPGVPPPGSPGTLQNFTVSGLDSGATYFFAIRSLDDASNTSQIDSNASSGNQARARVISVAPGTPQNLKAGVSSGPARIALSWDALTPLERGPDFSNYKLYRSTAQGEPGEVIGEPTGASFEDSDADPGTFYYYSVSGFDDSEIESPLSPQVVEDIAAESPKIPSRLEISAFGPNVILRWKPVTEYGTGRKFVDPANPALDELMHYEVFRTSEVVPANWVSRGTFSAQVSTYTEPVSAERYFYRVKAVQVINASPPSVSVALGGDVVVYAPDGISKLVIPAGVAETLSSEANKIGVDITIDVSTPAPSLRDEVYQAVSFVPTMGGIEKVYFSFPGLVRVELHYEVKDGFVAASQGFSMQSEKKVPAEEADRNLGIFWFNGARFVKLFGEVDKGRQVVTVETKVLGTFELQSLWRVEGHEFDLSGLSGRVITPNGDGLNDVVIFRFENAKKSFIEGKIFDLYGAFVSDMSPGPEPYRSLIWDGKRGGRAVPSGVYIYQLRGEGKTFNGTVVVAK